MAITTLPASPTGEINHNQVREKINETIDVVNVTELTGRIIVNSADDLSGTLDSTKEYFINGIIDMGSTQIVVPVGGLSLAGYNLDISGLTSSASGYTMFVSESLAIGSGNVLGKDYFVSVTGTGSKVYELYDATGNSAFEFVRINYINCTSLGDLYDYRQGLEAGSSIVLKV